MRLIIVGGGVFTWSFLWQLSKHKLNNLSHITILDGSKFFSPCSLNSTALVAKRANQFGTSELGDLIQNSWSWWQYLVMTHQWDSKQGVVSAPLIYFKSAHPKRENYLNSLPIFRERILFPSELKNFDFAVEPSYLVDPMKWMLYLKDSGFENLEQQGITYEHLEECATEVNNMLATVKTQNQLFSADVLVLQPGAYKVGSQKLVEKEEIIYGSFMDFNELPNFYPLSFSFSSSYQLYYNYSESRLQLGIYSSKELNLSLEQESLFQYYSHAKNDGWKIPNFESAKIKRGLRLKLKKRLPIIGKDQKCYYHLGGYKIGYLVSLFQSNQLVNMFMKDHQ